MTTAPTRPAIPYAGRPSAAAPHPQQRPAWKGLFQEPVYTDGPYDRGEEDEDTES